MAEERNMYIAPNQRFIEYRCTHCEWSLILEEPPRRKGIGALPNVMRKFREHDCKGAPKKTLVSRSVVHHPEIPKVRFFGGR
jgi:hypothetical protein